jgi:phenylacetate-CoA ligase
MLAVVAMRDGLFRDRAALEAHQLERLNALLAALRGRNRFYGPRLRSAGIADGVESLAAFRARMPFTTKAELVTDQELHPPYGTNLSFPLEAYTRLHATSSTSGRVPLRWLDTPESWAWLMDGWDHTLEGAGLGRGDRILFAFSFGPFIGFWVGFEAALRRGALCLPGGSLSSAARAELLAANRATAVCCTPTYALHLGEQVRAAGHALQSLRAVVVAGEPGGCVPATRARIEDLWGAPVFDHYGMTEVGPVTYQLAGHPGLAYLCESSYLVEVLDPDTGSPAEPGEIGELVLTTLGREGSPLLRYRTGDLVRECGVPRAADEPVVRRLQGGILARRDQMLIVRGVNVYPSAVDQVVREHAGVAEYQVQIDRARDLPEIRVAIEADALCADPEGLRRELERDLRGAFSLRIPVLLARAGDLPRYELKARRWVEAAR